MNSTEKIKKLQARLEQIEEQKINRTRIYEKGIEALTAEQNSIKARLYDLLYDQQKKK